MLSAQWDVKGREIHSLVREALAKMLHELEWPAVKCIPS